MVFMFKNLWFLCLKTYGFYFKNLWFLCLKTYGFFK